jgi:hypothetical protein
MIFPGLKDQQQVNDLWAYVKQFDAGILKSNLRIRFHGQKINSVISPEMVRARENSDCAQ